MATEIVRNAHLVYKEEEEEKEEHASDSKHAFVAKRIREQLQKVDPRSRAHTNSAWRRSLADCNARTKRRATAKEHAPTYSSWRVEGSKRNQTDGQWPAGFDRVRSVLLREMGNRGKRRSEKIQHLRWTYGRLERRWRLHCERMDSIASQSSEARRSTAHGGQLSIASPATGALDSAEGHASGGSTYAGHAASLAQTNLADEPSFSSASTRANRRNTQSGGLAGFGDAVRSEAEFLEILASLENADMQDPSMRAARTTATEPDMLISTDSVQDGARDTPCRIDSRFDDDNGFVADPVSFYLSEFDPDVWTEDEKSQFARRYALFPKQFGRIASALPRKSASQCVSFYYLTKKTYDYKALLTSRNRDRRRKTKLVKPKKGRGSALMADLKAATSVREEVVAEEEDATPPEPDAATASLEPNRRTARDKVVRLDRRTGATTLVRPPEAVALPSTRISSPPLSALTALPDEVNKQRNIARQPTSSYWSIAERTEFLRSLAINGRDWDALSRTLSTKSAAQARNYYVRNAEDADLIEAVQLARANTSLTIDERSEAAEALVRRRALTVQALSEPSEAVAQQRDRLNISALLNTESEGSAKSRRVSLSDWFGGGQSIEDSQSHSDHLHHQLGQSQIVPPVDPEQRYASPSAYTPTQLPVQTPSYVQRYVQPLSSATQTPPTLPSSNVSLLGTSGYLYAHSRAHPAEDGVDRGNNSRSM